MLLRALASAAPAGTTIKIASICEIPLYDPLAIDVLLADIAMPNEDGYSLIQKVILS